MSKPMVVDLTELFVLQEAFDNYAMKKHPNATDVKKKKCAALLVEIGELMNEWRGFKFWSNDQEPRIYTVIDGEWLPGKNPLLEEFVDCLHFAVSIALDYGYGNRSEFNLHIYPADYKGIIASQMFISAETVLLYNGGTGNHAINVLGALIEMGFQLGFTFEQMVEAFRIKDAENYKRQQSGY